MKEKPEFSLEGEEVPPKEEIKVPKDKPIGVDTGIMQDIPEPKKKRKRKPKKKGLELSDIKIPLGLLVMTITDGIGGKWVATNKELKDIEDGFNMWVELRLPILQKFAPELVLLIPIANYLTPRLRRGDVIKPKEIPKDKVIGGEPPTKEEQREKSKK